MCLAPIVVLVWACSAIGDDAANAKTLYNQAATALVQKEIPAAGELLARLVKEHASDELAPLAALHLAECQMAQGKWQQSIETFEAWIPRLAESSNAEMLEPNALLRAHSLLARAYLSTERWDRVIAITKEQLAHYATPTESQEKLLASLRTLSAQATTRQQQADSGALRSAAEAVKQKRFAQAISILAKVDSAQLTNAWQWRYHVLRAQSLRGTAADREALAELDLIQLDMLKESEKLPVRVAMFDSAVTIGNLSRAQKEIDALMVASSMDPELAATIRLRAIELAMLKKDRAAADQLALAAKQEFPKFAALHEFDLLRARNALAQVEFTTAREILQSIIEAPPASDPTAVPRAQWLVGESYLLSRDPLRAIAAYTAVIENGRAEVWVETALMQRGKCYELTGDLVAATNDYRQMIQKFPQSALKTTAQTRLNELETAVKTATGSSAAVDTKPASR